MVGYDPYTEFERLSTFEYGTAGTFSGVVTRFFVQPLDVLKIRFQLQVDPIRKERGKYHSMFQATRLIVKEEGAAALWKGHIPAQGLSVIYGVSQFGSFEFLTRTAWKYLPHKLTTNYYPITHFCAGGVAGMVAVTLSLPLDVIRTRLVAQGEPKIYRSVTHATTLMYRTEGIGSFYRGFVPTIVQIAPYSGLQFAFYSFFSHLWNRLVKHKSDEIGALESLLCGGSAGVAAKAIVYPLDMLKKRLQIIGFEEARRGFGTVHTYRGLIHCIGSILKHEGAAGLFKGLVPSLAKAAVSSGFQFLVYEQVCRLFKWTRHRKVPPEEVPAPSRTRSRSGSAL